MSLILEELYLKDNNLFTKYFKWTLDEYKEFRQEILQKDQRIAELEKEVKRLNTKLKIWNRFDKEDYIHRGENATERDYYYYTNGASSVLENEFNQLEHDLEVRDKELAELKEQAIVLPIGVGQKLYYINYIEMKVKSKVINCISIDSFTTNNYGTWAISEYGESWFNTKQEAEEALKKLKV